jgi:two-component system sensor histidine kinase/response regulator
MPVMDGFDFSEKIRALPGCEDTNIVMLTSGAGHSDAQRCQELRIDRHLMKPVKQSELLSAIFFALNLQHEYSELSSPETSEEPQSIGSLNILLAEDGIANQKLAVAMLSRWGHTVTIANNGYEALEALANKPFDLVLMDVQMPEMDGLEATEEIRKKEKPTGQHIPIIAMTAHAMAGDREKCLCAGMDEYLSKPVRKAELYEALQATIGNLGSNEVEIAGPTNGSPSSVVDWEAAFAVVDGDRELLVDIATAAIEELRGLIERLINAVDDQDAPGIQSTAHSVQGTLRVFQNVEASGLVQKLEILGRENRLDEVPALFERLKCLLEQILTELSQFIAHHS